MKNKILLLLALLLATASPHAFAQSRHTVAADAFFQAGEYFGALEKYKIAFAKENNRDQTSRIMFQLGECHRLMNQPVEAEEWFFKAIEARYQNTDVFLRYAQTLHKNAKYDEALAQFEEYARLVPNDPRADVGIQACEMARQWLEKPQRWEIANVAELNSPQSDFAPTFADKDQSLLYFTSTRDAATGNDINGVVGLNFSDIFMARLDRKDKWSEPVPAPGAINTPFDEGSAAFAPGFTQIYYTQCLQDRRQDLGCRLWWANLSDTAWAAPTEMDLVSDSSITLGHPALSPDGLALYFSSDMDGGRGGKDLWVMRRAATSASWGRPTNLGPEVNTPGDELFPAVAPDGTLHFASDYHPGMGGLDIFRAPRENGKHKVENLGFPLNTNADDFGITFFPEANRGFFSSTREGGRGSDDIYSFFLPALEFDLLVWVYDEESREPLANASVALTGSDGTQLAATTDDKGNARFDLKPETDYQLLATLERHLNGKAEESTKALAESMTLEAQIYLAPIGETVELPNIEYDLAKWDLRPESMVSLDKLLQTLENNPRITIELGSHTDFRGSDEYNRELAQKRAQSVVDYLISKGIAPDRLVAKGYGEDAPRLVDEKIAARVDFLKAGDRLNEAFINALAEESQKETAHQLNRRTEFRVLSTDYVPAEQRLPQQPEPQEPAED